MSLLLFSILGGSLLVWLILASRLLERLSSRYFLSEDEIPTAYARYDRIRHRPTSWIILALFHFLSLISFSVFISMVLAVMFGLGISFAYVFLGNLLISLPMMFFGLYFGALVKTESPFRLLAQKKSLRGMVSIYFILFATFSIITFSLILVNLVPETDAVFIIMGISILFLIFEGRSYISKSALSKVGVGLLIGALGCGILFQQQILEDTLMQYLVLASILLVMIAFTELSSSTQRFSFLLLSFVGIAFLLVLLLSFTGPGFFSVRPPIFLADIESILSQTTIKSLLDIKNIYGIRPDMNQEISIGHLLPVVMIPSVASGFLTIISWQSTAKQISTDSAISRVTNLSMFLYVAVQLLVLVFAFSMRNITPAIENLLLFENYFPAVLESQSATATFRSMVYIAVIYMTLLVVAPAFQLAGASMRKLSPSRVTKGILYLLIGGGTFLFFPQFTEDYVFLFLILFGSASAGVSAIYMSLGGLYLRLEEQGSRLLTSIVVLLFGSSIAGFLLVSYNLFPTEPVLGLGLQLMTPNFLILILAVIAVLFEIIIVITIQTKGLGELIPPDEAIPVEKDQNDLPPVPSPRENVTEAAEKET